MRIRSIALMCFGALGSSLSFAQTAGWQSVQGVLRDNNDILLSGNYDLEFRIYDAQTNGSLVDMDGDGTLEDPGDDVKTVTGLAINQGVFNTKFGPVAATAFNSNPRWLEIRIKGPSDPIFRTLSRVELVTAPASADQVTRPASGQAAITTATNGNVGIGELNPGTKLEVNGSIRGYATQGDAALRIITDSIGRGFRMQTVDFNNVSTGSSCLLEMGNGSGDTYGELRVVKAGSSQPGTLLLNAAGGNVGIGTSFPVAPLHVASNIGSAGGDGVPNGPHGGMRISHFDAGATSVTSNAAQAISFRTDGANPGSSTYEELLFAGSSSQNAYSIRATNVTNGSGSLGNLILQGQGGNVGIGTSTPTSLLHLRSVTDTNPPQITLQDPGNRTLVLSAPGNPQNARIGTSTNHDLNLITANTTRLTISSNGNVGVGIDAPTSRLHLEQAVDNRDSGLLIRGADNVNDVVRLYSRTNGGIRNGNLELSNGSSTQVHLSADPSLPAYLGMNGNVGIGTTTPNAKLEVAGNIIVAGCTGCASDARFKKNIHQLSAALSKLLALRGVSFNWTNPAEHGDATGPQLGFIAQEVEKVLPEWVLKGNDGYRYLNTNGFPALAVEAIREQQALIDGLRSDRASVKHRMEELAGENAVLRDRLAALEIAVGKLTEKRAEFAKEHR